MRERLVIGNWKMNTTLEEAVALAKEIGKEAAYLELSAKLAVCPPMPWLLAVKDALGGAPVALGAQNALPGEFGAESGSVSMGMIAPHVDYVIVGHSERRLSGRDTSETIHAKLQSALAYGLTPVLCVGEFVRLAARKRRGRPTALESASNIFRQLREALEGIEPDDLPGAAIAYEPVWAIGSGEAASAEYAHIQISQLREALTYHAPAEIAEQVRILYGGSVTGANAKDYAAFQDIDGVLVGGASLKAKDFLKIAAQFSVSST